MTDREEVRRKRRERRKTKKQLIRDYVWNAKANSKCYICGEDDPIVLSFHHRDPSGKEADPSNMYTNCWSIERAEKELAKCVILCLNCHRRAHFEHYNNTKDDNETNT